MVGALSQLSFFVIFVLFVAIIFGVQKTVFRHKEHENQEDSAQNPA